MLDFVFDFVLESTLSPVRIEPIGGFSRELVDGKITKLVGCVDGFNEVISSDARGIC